MLKCLSAKCDIYIYVYIPACNKLWLKREESHARAHIHLDAVVSRSSLSIGALLVVHLIFT